jgi:hypothetical protein
MSSLAVHFQLSLAIVRLPLLLSESYNEIDAVANQKDAGGVGTLVLAQRIDL